MKKITTLFGLLLILGLASCGSHKEEVLASQYNKSQVATSSNNTTNTPISSQTTIIAPSVLSTPLCYDPASEILINLDTKLVDNNNGCVIIEDNIIWILGEGIYSLTGTIDGQVIVDALDSKVELEVKGVNISNSSNCPLLINSADSCEISAKSDTINSIIDNRDAESESFNATIYSNCDLLLKGKGTLNIENNVNNGVHTKDDLRIKNLNLNVKAPNNALKGNDSLTIESGNITAVSTKGDALKTDNSDISSKGNQRGTITILGGTINLYSACDTIDASYNVEISDAAIVNCYTDSYSEYSEEVSATSTSELYLKINQSISSYRYAILFTLDDNTQEFVNGTSISSGGFRREVYYSYKLPSNALALEIYAYSSTTIENSTTDYLYKSECISINTSYDCLSVTKYSSSLSLSWTTYSTMQGPGGKPGMGGGMQDGNQDKAEYSCKGIKADNEININGGNITIKSHDDGIHANGDVTLENGNIGLGNVNISSGNIEIYTDDDGIHADYKLTITGGNIIITKSYEGLEANIITIDGGTTQLVSSDDGVNASAFKEAPLLNINSGILYLDASGDGLDSNGSIKMTGGYVIAQGPSNSGNGVLDYDNSFTSTGGYLLAIGASGMNQSVSASGSAKSATKTISTSTNSYVTLTVDNEVILIIKVTRSNMNYCVYSYIGTLGGVTVSTSVSMTLTNNLYYVKG